ncbi:MAG: electron transfer flavoprotein subunit alpha/FixB family protein [Anaerolineales bacterium]|nr:electron transfer flavoprotein subunit alpha/FixB family protein [Chloroflexota bacterium]MBL6981234.1 electron transfer flavoprotein subunit alpha/FixB family protein [Anaerolineales bacterium]
MSDNRNVWIFVEQEEGQIADVGLELLAKGRELADTLESQVWALVLGYQVAPLAERVIHHGADRVLLANHPELELYRTLPYSRVIIEQVQAHQPYIFLLGATPVGRDLAPRVASATNVGLTADCTDLQIGDYLLKKEKREYKDLLYQIRPAFGGNIIATIVNPKTRPQMATVREGVMQPNPPDLEFSGEVEIVEPSFEPSDFALHVLSREIRQPTVKLKDAPVIVAGGGGVSSEDESRLIEELAHILGGEVGASRAAVDAGFFSHEHQIGQTGATVRPRLYIAAGISGAIQHSTGMDESNKIISINTDPDAPISKIAHYKIVGDIAEVLPLLINALREKSR